MVLVSDLMSCPVVSVAPDTAAANVATLLASYDISQLPVVAQDGSVVGLVSQRDIDTVRWHSAYRSMVASDIMSKSVIAIEADKPVERAVGLLNAFRFRALPVMQQGMLVGIISITDILDYFRSEGRQERALLSLL